MLYDLVLKDTASQRSAVSGMPWKGLSKAYRKEKSKIAPGIANLELHGDMLDALKTKPYRDGIEIGIYDSNEALKADNHNKFSAKSRGTNLPKRQFIPNKGEEYRKGILDQLKTTALEILGNE